jgi:hypothetical protein
MKSLNENSIVVLQTITLITTHSDSLSIATDDSDTHPTISKFPKTRPLELIYKQDENGQEIVLVDNYVKILAVPTCVVFILLFISNYFYFLMRFCIDIIVHSILM